MGAGARSLAGGESDGCRRRSRSPLQQAVTRSDRARGSHGVKGDAHGRRVRPAPISRPAPTGPSISDGRSTSLPVNSSQSSEKPISGGPNELGENITTADQDLERLPGSVERGAQVGG